MDYCNNIPESNAAGRSKPMILSCCPYSECFLQGSDMMYSGSPHNREREF